MDKKPKPKLKLLHLPTTQDLIMNKIESLDQSLVGNVDLLYYIDEMLCVAENQMLALNPDLSHELNMCMDRLAESRHWLGEFLTDFEITCTERKNTTK